MKRKEPRLSNDTQRKISNDTNPDDKSQFASTMDGAEDSFTTVLNKRPIKLTGLLPISLKLYKGWY